MKVACFGASGYLGSHGAEQLTLHGHQLIALVRGSSRTEHLDAMGITHQVVDFNDHKALVERLQGLDAAVNCIGDARLNVRQSDLDQELHVLDNILCACARAEINRFVQLSTVMVYGFERPTTAIDESFIGTAKYEYTHHARAREAAVMRYADKLGVAILQPANSTGVRDDNLLPPLAASHKQGVFVTMGGNAEFSCIDGRDVGRALTFLCETRSLTGEFLVKGYDTNWLALKACLDERARRNSRRINIPRPIALGLALIQEMLIPKGKGIAFNRFSVDVLSTNALFDDSKIRAAGFAPRYTLHDSVAAALEK